MSGEHDVSPQRIAASRNVGDSVDLQPAVASQPGRTGIGVVDKGMACDGKSQGDCFLSHQQRRDLMTLSLIPRMASAETNYKFAIHQLKDDQRVKDEGDVHWLLFLVLEVAQVVVIGKFAKAMSRVRNAGLERTSEILHSAAIGSDAPSDLVHNTHVALSRVSDDAIKDGVEIAMDTAKRGAQGIKPDPGAAEGVKANTNYLQQLADDAGVGFDQMRAKFNMLATDAELLALHESFEPKNHTVSAYVAALDEKLKRYVASGVAKVGRTRAQRKTEVGDLGVTTTQEVIRDTRVIWVRYSSGRIELRYQHFDGRPASAGVMRADDPEAFPKQRTFYGPSDPVSAAPDLGAVVPAEFIETALARNLAQWGIPAGTIDAEERKNWYDLSEYSTNGATREPQTASVATQDGRGT